MLYEIIPWIRFLVSEVGIVWRGARGTLVALGAARVASIPWLRLVVRCAGEASPMRVKSGYRDRMEERVAHGLHVLLPVSAHAGDTCVIFLSEWMGGSSVRILSRVV